MPRKYSPSEKSAALEHLHKTGNFPLTALQTGISERTLYTWRQQELLQQTLQQQPSTPPLQKEIPEFEDNVAALDFIRQQIMAELLNIANNFQSEMAFTTPTQRVMLISQLMDRFMKLDEYLSARQEEEIQYVYEYEYAVEHHVEKKPSTYEDTPDEEDLYPRSRIWSANMNSLDTPDDDQNTPSLNGIKKAEIISPPS